MNPTKWKPKEELMDEKNEMKKNIPIVEVLKSLGVSGIVETSPGRFKALCPLHEDHSPSLHIDAEKNVCNCVVCGKHKGDICSVAMTQKKTGFGEAVKYLRKNFSAYISSPSASPASSPKPPAIEQVANHVRTEISSLGVVSPVRKEENAPLAAAQPKLYGAIKDRSSKIHKIPEEEFWNNPPPLIAPLRNLAREKGLTFETVKYFGLSYSQQENRVQIPIYNDQGEIVGLVGRRNNPEDEIKYKFPQERFLRKGLEIYWFHEALKNQGLIKKHGLTLVEGFSDLWKLWQNGYKNTVALMWNRTAPDQERKIVELVKECKSWINLFLDNNEARRLGQVEITERLITEI